MMHMLIPQVRSNPRAQPVCAHENKPDVDQHDELEQQMVHVRNGVEE